MPSSKLIVLCSTLHDPSGELFLALEKAAPLIKEQYAHWVIAVTKTTDKRIIDALRSAGFDVAFEGLKKISSDEIENNHLLAIDRGMELVESGQWLQYTDGDRVIYGAAYFPEIFEETVLKIESVSEEIDYVSLTRSISDNQSHHDALVLTEQYITMAYQKALGKKVDPCSTAHVFSKEAGTFLLQNTDKHGVMKFPHGKWAILMKEGAFNTECIETSGILSFETPLQSGDSMTGDAFIGGGILPESAKELREAYAEHRLPSLDALREYYFFTVQTDAQAGWEEWRRRCDLAEEWMRFLDRELENLHLSGEERKETKLLIDETMLKLNEIKIRNVDKKPIDASMDLRMR